MKSRLFFLVFMSAIIFGACQSEERLDDGDDDQQIIAKADDKKRYIIHISWDPGREKDGCNGGFGMCNVEICAFCCFKNGVRVPCKDSKSAPRDGGMMYVDLNTSQGYIEFLLNPENGSHSEAIKGKSIFYVDNSLNIGDCEIVKGEYEFDPERGDHGGYKILVRKSK